MSIKLMCLVCGKLSSQSKCSLHRTKQSRGYGAEHEKLRKTAMMLAPYCWKCGCHVSICKLEWHHVIPIQGGRNLDIDDRRQLLCQSCHLKVKEI